MDEKHVFSWHTMSRSPVFWKVHALLRTNFAATLPSLLVHASPSVGNLGRVWSQMDIPLKNMKVSWDDYSQYMEKTNGESLITFCCWPACDLLATCFAEIFLRKSRARKWPLHFESNLLPDLRGAQRCDARKLWCSRLTTVILGSSEKRDPLDVVHESSFYVFFLGRTCSNLSGHCWGLRGEWSYFVTWPKLDSSDLNRYLKVIVIEGYWPPSQLDGCNLQCNHFIDLIPNLSFLPFMCPEVEFLYSLAWLDNVTGGGYPRTRGNCNRKPNTRHGNHGSTALWLASVFRISGLDGLEFSSLWKAAQGATGILGRHCQRSGGLAASVRWPVRWLFGGHGGAAQVVDLMLAAVEKAVALPAGTLGMGSPGVLLTHFRRFLPWKRWNSWDRGYSWIHGHIHTYIYYIYISIYLYIYNMVIYTYMIYIYIYIYIDISVTLMMPFILP